MIALQVLGVFLLGATLGTLVTRIARKRGVDVRKKLGNLT